MNTSKIIKTAKVLDTVFRILQKVIAVCALVAVALLGVFTILNAVRPNTIIGSDFNIVDIGPLTIELAKEYTPDNTAILIYAWVMAAAAVAVVAVVCYALGIIRKIFAPMTQGNPFHPAVGKEIRKLAFSSLAIGILQNIMRAVEVLNALRMFHLDSLLQSSQIRSVTANFRYDLSFILVFFVLLLLSYVFHYGEQLQKLSDETV